MWRNHAQEMYKNFSFIVTWRTKCGVINTENAGGSRRFFGMLSTDNFDKMGAKCSENEKSVCLRAIIF